MREQPAHQSLDSERDPATAQWRALLEGSDPTLRKARRVWRHVPAGPRCKVCAAPFHGLGAIATRLIMHGQVEGNPLMCKTCFRSLAKQPGGAEVDVSTLFADIRGSTALAERVGADRFRRLSRGCWVRWPPAGSCW